SVLFTSLTLALLGVAVGMVLGTSAAIGLATFIEEREFITFSEEVFAWAFGVGFVTGVLGGILPAISAARVSPMETLR
ncbi:ABC transporter permease, partial [Candidatus Saccharibacteria bacterium]|nr:ABC transporter permease [Candidatus Saccharibacteria bacterium]